MKRTRQSYRMVAATAATLAILILLSGESTMADETVAQDCSIKLGSEVARHLGYDVDGDPQMRGPLVACKIWPPEPALALVAVAQETAEPSGTEGIGNFDLNVLMVKSDHGEVVTKSRVSERIQNYNSPVSLALDTAPYRLAPNVRAFGVRVESGSGRVELEQLHLFVAEEQGFREILSLETSSEYDAAHGCGGLTTNRTIAIGKGRHNGFSDLRVTLIKDQSFSPDCAEDTSRSHKKQTRTLVYDGSHYILDKSADAGDDD